MARIALNTMGTDLGHEVMVEAAHEAQKEGIEVVLFGPMDLLRPLTDLEIKDCLDVISMDEKPDISMRNRTDSSLVRAAMSVGSGETDAVVDCGNTGAALTVATLKLGRFRNLGRATIGAKIPRLTKKGKITHSLLVDAGANTEAKPDWMAQWGLLGSALLSTSWDISEPRVGLLSNGEEAIKGTDLVRRTHEILAALSITGAVNFVGNLQGGACFDGSADVAVTDGFTGNLLLKQAEVLAPGIIEWMKTLITNGGMVSKIGGKLIQPALQPMKAAMNKDNSGGSLLLGVNYPFVIGHGSSNSSAALNAIRLAERTVRDRTVENLREAYANSASALK